MLGGTSIYLQGEAAGREGEQGRQAGTGVGPALCLWSVLAAPMKQLLGAIKAAPARQSAFAVKGGWTSAPHSSWHASGHDASTFSCCICQKGTAHISLLPVASAKGACQFFAASNSCMVVRGQNQGSGLQRQASGQGTPKYNGYPQCFCSPGFT